MLLRSEFKSWLWPGVLDTTLCDKVCQWITAGWWFSLSIKHTATIQLICCWKWC